MHSAPQTYRQAPPRCPGCGSVMEERGPAESRIDLCRACGGVWFDWGDGEVSQLARAVDQAAVPVTGREGAATGECPRCHTSLMDEKFLGEGPEVRRCTDCQGLFLRQDVVPLVAAFSPSAPPPREQAGPVDKLMGLLRSMFGDSA